MNIGLYRTEQPIYNFNNINNFRMCDEGLGRDKTIQFSTLGLIKLIMQTGGFGTVIVNHSC